jgi:hypothetical protein
MAATLPSSAAEEEVNHKEVVKKIRAMAYRRDSRSWSRDNKKLSL